ncbi:MAG TPA: hypothetical protein DF774_14430 [Rheinheimera sp.]|uniref:hypothetical protein n=1 Tax=Rheinheimera sp. TaxID=1869214 RepID=UPI000ECF4EB4|nr:hypothetical protein [Rheinheimera sp.]HCU66949.1 hypothetical protein [Rheinheimera sp.]
MTQPEQGKKSGTPQAQVPGKMTQHWEQVGYYFGKISYGIFKRFLKLKYKIATLKLRAFFIFIMFLAGYYFLSHELIVESIFDQYLIDTLKVQEAEMRSYKVSYAASVIDTLIFFITVGLGIAIYGLTKPEDSSFEKKINYLFPRAALTVGGKKYLLKQINKLAVISERTRVTFQIDEHCFDHNLTGYTMIYEQKISNLHNKQSFMDEDVKFVFSVTEETKNAILKRDGKSRSWGKVHKIRTMTSDDIDRWRWHTKGKHLLLADSKKDIFKLNGLTIPPDGEAQLDVISSTLTYNDGNDAELFGVARFTELLELYFVNNTQYDASIEIRKVTMDEYSLKGSKVLAAEDNYEFTLDLAKTSCVQDEFAQSTSRRRQCFREFSVDDLILWKVTFKRSEEPELAKA